MKKVLPAIVLASALMVLVVPLMVSAQTTAGPADCCVLRRDVQVEGVTVKAGGVASPGGLTSCNGKGNAIAAVDGTPPSGITAAEIVKNNWGVICLMNTINTIVDWIFTVLIIISVIMVILGAVNYLTSGGNPEKLTAGKNYIMYALIGVAIAFLARAIPAIFKAITGV